ncbi:sensor histidine kinase [Actinokineospora guangxiensis]|uniref:histidine kinase n=1 Tax=Actinokineospora guangxiensis TaxID=1490288 RepID=A0ABW0EUQ8_9PSEU
MTELLRLTLADDEDVFRLRQSSREVAELAGLSSQDQIRVATALSDLGRVAAAGSDVRAVFAIGPDASRLDITLTWTGAAALGNLSWNTVRKLMDGVALSSAGQRHTVTLVKQLPGPMVLDQARAAALRARLAEHDKATALDDLRAQNEHLLTLLDELERGKQELLRLNAELDETNKGVMALYTELSEELDSTNQGVVALYAELEDKTEQLAAASEAKTRYWANVSHELRSPLNSIIGLAGVLLDPEADPLTDVQRRQVELINSSGAAVLVMTNDLLDVAKAEAGRVEAHLAPVDLRVLFTQLRGALQAAHDNADVVLVVEDPPSGELPGAEQAAADLHTDEMLLDRVLRNAVTNALKFTERGSVRLSARRIGAEWEFTVADTGIGIPAEHLDRVFEEFHQVPHQLQRGGIGLGLPYAKTLTSLLGGELTLASEVGAGTTVTVRLPAPVARRALVVDPDADSRARLANALAPFAAEVVQATDFAAAGPGSAEVLLVVAEGTAVPAEFAAARRVVLTSGPADPARPELSRSDLSPAAVVAAVRALGEPR